ncbi:quinone-dependent dihydroorotate dehydrogenase [Schaalia sp. 19OD2882]|uniref:quinone-dependent dihydroorotate dehydrogenase n=1 Tax=Schaalia sp. 19OD2882 TaxID=2794089 RepID=UPI001C1F0D57|nr:quinone-dependent dihydroorotate dehydrogenase [Schaalia sp. 19OD2882]QWW20424.1 quinone-dependent dihydroorotate dehydrogenase [Schaalia sp. 19OD2882]
MIGFVYRLLFRTLIRHTDPEAAHHHGLSAIALAGSALPTRRLMRSVLGHARTPEPHGRQVRIGPRIVPGRLGLAAGMDKDAQAVLGLTAMGFAFVEVGTITALPQPGNDEPRLWRLPEAGALRNRMGFNNGGAQAAAERLKALRSTPEGRAAIVGANIGKNKMTPEHLAAEDYRMCARMLAKWVDFVVVNVSSPNTPGLRDLQSVDHLRPILEAARLGCEESCTRRIPLLVKISPDLADEDVVAVAELARELGLEGIVATNTTTAHDMGEGGLSGRPLKERALEVVRLVARHMDDDQVLIGVGGISDQEDALDMLEAGADLVEAFTAFVYEGPSWPGRINRALAAY